MNPINAALCFSFFAIAAGIPMAKITERLLIITITQLYINFPNICIGSHCKNGIIPVIISFVSNTPITINIPALDKYING